MSDRWRNDRERFGYRDDDRDRWRDQGRGEDFGRGGRGGYGRDDWRSGGYGRGEERGSGGGDYREERWGGDYGQGYGADRGRGHPGGERRGAFGDEGGFGGEGRRSSGGGYGPGYGGNDYTRGFYGADQGYRGERGRGEESWGYRGERSAWDRFGDEVSSWFGDDEAARRRERDAREGEWSAQHHRGRGPKGYARSDERIREDVNDRLTDDPHLDASEIEVTVQNREVTLSGTVNSRFEKRHAEDIAESVSGVTHVQNNLRVQSQMATLMGGGAGESSGAGVTGTGPTGMAGGTSTGSPGAATVEVSRAGGTNRKTGTRT